MTHGFIALIFNFCAAMSPPGEDAGTIQLGYQSQGECVVRMIVGDSHGDTVTINGHAVGVELLVGGAQVTIDGQGFALIETNEA